MESSPSDAELIESAKHGDRSAFSELAKRYTPYINARALFILRDANDAMDVTQIVLREMFQRPGQFPAPAGFKTWLCAVIRNKCADMFRARRRDQAALAELNSRLQSLTTTAQDSALDDLIQMELRHQFEIALPRLDDMERTLLGQLLDGLSCAAIARDTGQPESTTRDRISYLIQKLRNFMK